MNVNVNDTANIIMKNNLVPLLFNIPDYPNYHNRGGEYANFVSQYLIEVWMIFNRY